MPVSNISLLIFLLSSSFAARELSQTLALNQLSLFDDGAPKCSGNCVMCEHDQCRACFNSNIEVSKDGNTCSTKRSRVEHNCEIMIADSKKQYCHLCKQHHVAEYLDPSAICRPVPTEQIIPECSEYSFTKEGIICTKCQGKGPSADLKSCQQLEHKIRNCLVYQRDSFNTTKVKCSKCIPQFVYDQSTEKCVPENQETIGCQTSVETKCLLCDYQRGYFALDNYRCQKSH